MLVRCSDPHALAQMGILPSPMDLRQLADMSSTNNFPSRISRRELRFASSVSKPPADSIIFKKGSAPHPECDSLSGAAPAPPGPAPEP